MKKLLSLLLVLAACFTCGDKGGQEPDVLELNMSNLSFSETEGSQYVSLTCNADWTATFDAASWLECVPVSGKGNARVQIKVSANNTSAIRTATVTFKPLAAQRPPSMYCRQ